jgi:hypothetical protein
MPAQPFPSSYTGVIRLSHMNGFGTEAPSWLPRCAIDGAYVPEARAAAKAALRWRRRRTERVTRAAKIVTNKARITDMGVSRWMQLNHCKRGN